MVKDGFRFALPPLIVGIALILFRWWWGAILVALGLFVLYFFRDPERRIPMDPGAVVSPADGRVVEIVDEPSGGRPGTRVSIFLSIFDVHVNRAPVAGQVCAMDYHPGNFMFAWKGQASQANEQNVITIAAPAGKITFKQIAGWVARRILCWTRVGDEVKLGQRIGMIRFGSRVDIWLPADAEVLVQRGQHVAGGATQIARWQSMK
jgi:phosphatidylserine decarboxylase